MDSILFILLSFIQRNHSNRWNHERVNSAHLRKVPPCFIYSEFLSPASMSRSNDDTPLKGCACLRGKELREGRRRRHCSPAGEREQQPLSLHVCVCECGIQQGLLGSRDLFTFPFDEWMCLIVLVVALPLSLTRRGAKGVST